jgi:pimeloyl-ACP methyl ester carboxylesterase
VRTDRVEVAPGVALAVRRWDGDGAPFLLVHGLASNARLWDGVAGALAGAGRAVVAVDQRGHGLSDKPDAGYDMASVADDLAALIDRLGLDRPVVAGQSWGGNVVLELAHRHPEVASAIACVDGGWLHLRDRFPEWDECARAMRPPPLAGLQRDDIAQRMRTFHPDWSLEAIEGAMANFEVLPDGTIRPWLTLDRHLAVLRGMWEHTPRDLYPTLQPHVLLVPADDGSNGEWSRAKRLAVEEAAAAIPAASVRWYGPPADHDVHAQHPAALAHDLMELR